MPTVYLTPESEQQWLDWRLDDLTSTEASALFNLSPYETRYELWHRKRDRKPSPFDDNERIQAGRHIEPAIASLVAERYGVVVEPFKVYARDTDDRLGSSFDYRITGITLGDVPDHCLRRLFTDHGPGILECKNVDGLVFRRKWLDDETPAHIEVQLQHQLELTGDPWGCIVALVGGNRLCPYPRLRDRQVGRGLRAEAARFWQSIAADQPPEPIMPDDAEAVIALNQFADGSTVDRRGDAEMASLAAEYAALAASTKAAEERQKVIRAMILESVGPASAVLYNGGKLTLSQVADNPGKIITPEMVGTTINARKGYRMFRIYPTKGE